MFTRFPPPVQRLLWSVRVGMSYLALAGGFGSLIWLSQQLEAVPQVRLTAWEVAPLVVVDAGHGGHDGGAVAGGAIEKNLALDLALQLRQELLRLGLRVQMTRETDVFLPLEERAALADRVQAAAFVSLHLNTSAASEVSGIETYYTEQKSLPVVRALQTRLGLTSPTVSDQRGRWLADHLQRHSCLTTQAENRGIKERNYAVVSQTQVPAALIECGFLTHATEASRLKQAAYQARLITGIAQGLAEFLKIQQAQPLRGVKASVEGPDKPRETETPTQP